MCNSRLALQPFDEPPRVHRYNARSSGLFRSDLRKVPIGDEVAWKRPAHNGFKHARTAMVVHLQGLGPEIKKYLEGQMLWLSAHMLTKGQAIALKFFARTH